MTLRRRLAFGILAIVMVMMLPLALSIRAMMATRRDTERLRDVEFRSSVLLGKATARLQELSQGRVYLSLFPNTRAATQYQGHLDTLAAHVDSIAMVANVVAQSRLRASLEAIGDEARAAVSHASQGRMAPADSIVDGPMSEAMEDAARILSLTELAVQEQTRERVSAIASHSENARRGALTLLAGAALLAVLIGLWLTQSVSQPIDELEAGMRAVSEGDFGRPIGIDATRLDEFGRLAVSYNSMATQLRELDRLKAEFVSVASHELKTPINVITGYLQLLREHVYGPLTDRQREVIDTLAAQGKALARLVRGLLDVSRFEAGGGRIDPRQIAFPAFLSDLERTFRVLAIQREVHFDVVRGESLPAEVTWDPEQVNEVIGNLLSNAFKFTPKGGRVRLDVSGDAEQVVMTVSDTGAGIPAAQLPYVFEKFYTADNQTTGLKGTGLGLAIAKAIVTAHGGSVTVESGVGSGTAFTILLPWRASATRVPPVRSGEPI